MSNDTNIRHMHTWYLAHFDLHAGTSFLGVVVSVSLISTILFTICPCVIIIIVAVIVVRSNRRRNVNVTTTTVAPQTTVSTTDYSQVDAYPLKPPASAPPDPSISAYPPPEQPALPYSQNPPDTQDQLYEYHPSK